MEEYIRGDPDYPLQPRCQLALLCLSIFLFILWYFRVFSDNDHNVLVLFCSIVVFLHLITVIIRYMQMGSRKSGESSGIIEVPECIRCLFGEVTCDRGHFNGWGVLHIIIYIILGILVPGQYLLVLIISIFYEGVEAAIGFASKYIVDPLTNMFGYWIGNMIYSYMFPKVPRYYLGY